MGDIGFLIKGVTGIGLGAVVGAVHGVVDGYGNLSQAVPQFTHELAKYAPAVFSGIYVGTERNGQWTIPAMIGGGITFAGLTVAATGVGYVAGRVIGGGIDKLIH